MAKEYLYWATTLSKDGVEELLDLEEHGWADKERLANCIRFALIPKDDAPQTLDGGRFPPVVVNIPDGAKPVFKSRVKNAMPTGDTDGRHPVSFRIYGIGYKLGKHEPMLWVLPNGAIEVGEDSIFSDQLLRYLTFWKYRKVSAEDFHSIVTEVVWNHPIGIGKGEDRVERAASEWLTPYTVDDYRAMKCYLADDNLSGYAIKKDNDLVSVFNVSNTKRGRHLIGDAIRNGAETVDVFDEDNYLPKLYGTQGFIEYRREKWNPEHAPKNWTGGTPDVVYMRIGSGAEEVKGIENGSNKV